MQVLAVGAVTKAVGQTRTIMVISVPYEPQFVGFRSTNIVFIDVQILSSTPRAPQANSTDSAAKRMIMWDIYMAGGFGTHSIADST